MLAQPDLFEYWSIEHVVEGWGYYLVELGLAGFAMLAGFAFAESMTEGDGPRRAIAVGIVLPASAALGYALAVWLLYSPGFSIFSMQYIGDTLRMTALGAAVALIYMLRRRSDAATNAMHETKVAQQALAKQTLEARLQLMEAQIEPLDCVLDQRDQHHDTEAGLEIGRKVSAKVLAQGLPPDRVWLPVPQ
jgi:hypothetical protein